MQIYIYVSLPKLSRLTAAGALEEQADWDARTQNKENRIKNKKYINMETLLVMVSNYAAPLNRTMTNRQAHSALPHLPRSNNMGHPFVNPLMRPFHQLGRTTHPYPISNQRKRKFNLHLTRINYPLAS